MKKYEMWSILTPHWHRNASKPTRRKHIDHDMKSYFVFFFIFSLLLVLWIVTLMCSYLFPLRRNTVFYSLHILQRSSTFYYLYIFFFAHLLNFMHREGNDFTCPLPFPLAEFANRHKCIFSAPPTYFLSFFCINLHCFFGYSLYPPFSFYIFFS